MYYSVGLMCLTIQCREEVRTVTESQEHCKMTPTRNKEKPTEPPEMELSTAYGMNTKRSRQPLNPKSKQEMCQKEMVKGILGKCMELPVSQGQAASCSREENKSHAPHACSVYTCSLDPSP